jgi:hypothetical protein
MVVVSLFYRMENIIKDNFMTVINMGKEHTNGPQEIFILGTSNMTKERALELMSGKMEGIIGGSGKPIV